VNLFEEIAVKNNRHISKKSVKYEPAINKTFNFVSPGVP
jgi:hypothetical protein